MASEAQNPESTVKQNGTRRYPSIDFLRGIAIFMMLLLHIISGTLDVDYYIDRISDIPLINIYALIVLPFLGGLAGLFLMTSAIGNMVSMVRNYEKGHTRSSILQKSLVVGFLVVVFAYLSEGLLGYHGSLGEVFKHLDDLSEAELDIWRYRGYHFETLHTIGWALILNGITHTLITMKYDVDKDRDKIIRVYWILAIIVVSLTGLIWTTVSQLIPGYPFAINPVTDVEVYTPYIGISPWSDFILYFFLNPLAAHIEPMFPYLATSYIGSNIGLQITRRGDDFSKGFMRSYFRLGLVAFIVGFIGVVVVLINLLNNTDLDTMLGQYRIISFHRSWTAEQGTPGGWLFQYLTLNGVAVMLVMLSFRLAEYRGPTAYFARMTSFVRRFGFLGLTVYTIQFVTWTVWFLVSISLGQSAYTLQRWWGTGIILVLTILANHLILRLWERKGYLGSMEWMISTIANTLLRIKKQNSLDNTKVEKWYQRGVMNVEDVFYHPTWISFPVENGERRLANDLRLTKYLAIAGIFFFPLSFLALMMLRSIGKQNEGVDYGNAKLLTYVSFLFTIGLLAVFFTFSLSSFGIAL